MRKIYFYILIIFPVFAFLLEQKPWLGNIYEFNFISEYSFYYFSKVDSSVEPLGKTWKNNLFTFGLDFAFSSSASVDLETELISDEKQSFAFQSVALQGRYLILDDITKDPVSLVLSSSLRFIPKKSLYDIASDYHGNVELEVNGSLGKEFAYLEYWAFRTWANLAFCIANKGAIWLKGQAALGLNNQDLFNLYLILDSAHNYGRKTVVNVKNFKGYGSIREKFIDLALRCSYKLNIWGFLAFEYKRRLYARRSLKNVNTFSVIYTLPFSF